MLTRSWNEVWARRLARQFLAEPASADELVSVVGAIGGVQAQMMPSAELAIGLRAAGVTRADVRRELWEHRTLAKTYGARGTIHLYPSHELGVWLAALRAVRDVRDPGAPEGGALTPRRRDEVVAAIADALDVDGGLTRDELGEEVARRTGSWALAPVVPAFGTMWPRWTAAIGDAASRGVLCFGSNRGSRVTFVQPDRWFGPADAVEPAEALAAVFRRYLRAFGPATPRDFARWFNMDPVQAEQLARAPGADLVEVDVEGRVALDLAEDAGAAPLPTRGAVHLLPPFDGYVIGCLPRDRLMPPDLLDRIGHDRVRSTWARKALSGGTVANIPVLLLDGVVAGVWERRRAGRRLEVRVEPFVTLDGGQTEGLDRIGARIGEILEMDATFELGPVEVRPHL